MLPDHSELQYKDGEKIADVGDVEDASVLIYITVLIFMGFPLFLHVFLCVFCALLKNKQFDFNFLTHIFFCIILTKHFPTLL